MQPVHGGHPAKVYRHARGESLGKLNFNLSLVMYRHARGGVSEDDELRSKRNKAPSCAGDTELFIVKS